MNKLENNRILTLQSYEKDLEQLKLRFATAGLMLVTILLLPIISVSLYRGYHEGWQAIHFIYSSIGFGVIVPTFIIHKRLSYQFITMIILIAISVVGLSGLLTFGLTAGASLLIWAFGCAFCTALLGSRWGYAYMFSCGLILAVIGFAISTGRYSLTFNMDSYALSSYSWSLRVVAFLIFTALIVHTFGIIYKHLLITLYDLSEGSQDLASTNVRLRNEIKARERTEAALTKSDAQYRLIAENISDIFWSMTLDGKLTYISPSVERLLGFTQEEAMAGDLNMNLHPDQLDENISRSFEYKLRHKSGISIDAEVIISLIRDKSGTPTEITGVTRDITERKILQQQLVLSQRAESVGLLAGGVAHDINNLLMPIFGYSELLRLSFEHDNQQIEDIDHILLAANKAADLVQQLLAFGSNQTLEYKSIELNSTIENFSKLLKSTLRENIILNINLDSNKHQIWADEIQIEQVIMNLFVNAQHAMPTGGSLTINTSLTKIEPNEIEKLVLSKPGYYAILEMIDTGMGMSQETTNRIFEPFFTTKGAAGTGLGLATSFGTIKQHGGNIIVHSDLGKGTGFKIYLPILEKDNP